MPRENEPNPDVNWQIVDDDYDADKSLPGSKSEKGDIKQPEGDEGIRNPETDNCIPLPDDQKPAYPVEEPPGADGPPVGDVDDSPKRIA